MEDYKSIVALKEPGPQACRAVMTSPAFWQVASKLKQSRLYPRYRSLYLADGTILPAHAILRPETEGVSSGVTGGLDVDYLIRTRVTAELTL